MTQAAQATIKAPAPRLFYLAMDDQYESLIAQAWAKKTDKPVVHYIPLERLTLEMVIVPVVRNAMERTPMLQEEFDAHEQRRKTVRLKGEDCLHELHECKPVRVSDFWNNGGPRGSDAFSELLMGKLDQDGFINALNESTAPHGVYPRTHHGDDNRILKLTWGC